MLSFEHIFHCNAKLLSLGVSLQTTQSWGSVLPFSLNAKFCVLYTNAKICVTPNANSKICVTPQRHESVEYRLCWVPNATFLHWPCTFHFCVCRFHLRWVRFFSGIWALHTSKHYSKGEDGITLKLLERHSNTWLHILETHPLKI